VLASFLGEGHGGIVAAASSAAAASPTTRFRARGGDPLRDAAILPHPLGGWAGAEEAPVDPPGERGTPRGGSPFRGGGERLGEEESRGILEAYGFTFPRHAFAGTSDAAVAAYRRWLRVRGDEDRIAAGLAQDGCREGFGSAFAGAEDVARAFMEITSSVRRLSPVGMDRRRVDPGDGHWGRELIVGMSRDPQFGPLLMFGLGGIYVEVLKDVAFRVAPVSRRAAEEMVREIRAWPLLAAYREASPADEGAIVDALLQVSRLSCDFPEIQEKTRHQPVAGLPKGKGIRAIDCRMTSRRP